MKRKKMERGSALIITTILVLVLAASSVALMTEVAFVQKRGTQSRDADEGYVIARAGLERTRRAMHQYYATAAWNSGLGINGAAQWTDILVFNNPNQSPGPRIFNTAAVDFEQQVRQNFDTLRVGAAFVAYRSNPEAPGAATTPEAPAKNTLPVLFGQVSPYRKGGYLVTIRNNATDPGGPLVDTDRTVVATVTSVIEDPERTIRRLEADLFYDLGFYDPDAALLTNGSLNISGDPIIKGLKGSVHANQNLEISGNPVVEDNATAVGTANISGSPSIGGTLAGSQTAKELPPINPADFFDDRDYLMRADGRIYDKNGVLVFNASGGGAWHGFKYGSGSPPKWDLIQPGGDGLPPPATYYIEGQLVIGANIGNQASDPPLRATFITTHSIEISGNPGLAPYLADVQAIAGTDLKIGGTPDLDAYQGFYGAREQVMISGNPVIFGAIVAENAANVDGTVNPGTIGSSQVAMVINGNPTITFNGGLNTMIGEPPRVEILQLRLIR